MKSKRITISACALFIMLGFITSGISMLNDERAKSKHEKDENQSTEAAYTLPSKEEESIEKKYVLKVQDGIVVVFGENDLTRPIIVTDIYAGTLRNFDREQLNNGIVAQSYFEMQSMLEDYSS